MSSTVQPQSPRHKSKLRPLVITMGSERKAHIESLFSHPSMAEHFETPVFSPGIPSRSIRNQMTLLTAAGKAGILPPHEWAAISSPRAQKLFEDDAKNFLEECLKDVPVKEGRHGAKYDVERHYAKELWQKGKALNRGRSVMACSLAHLMAMKTLVNEGFDFILEDNVRAPLSTFAETIANNGNEEKNDQEGNRICECARRVRNTIEASMEMELTTGIPCHLRFFGWLGSRPNLEFVMNTFLPERKFCRDSGPHQNDNCQDLNHDQHQTVFPYVQKADVEEMLGEEYDEKDSTKAGGSPLWGAFAYWVSKEGYNALIESLQNDVGAMLWKGKRMRCYQVKPIDKIIPRRIANAFTVYEDQEEGKDSDSRGGTMVRNGREHIHVATHPAFFRAPMLTSQIHAKWDGEFCRSTEYQIWRCNQKNDAHLYTRRKTDVDDSNLPEIDMSSLQSAANMVDDATHNSNELGLAQGWGDLWLTDKERRIVDHRMEHNEWLTMTELEEMSNSSASSKE